MAEHLLPKQVTRVRFPSAPRMSGLNLVETFRNLVETAAASANIGVACPATANQRPASSNENRVPGLVLGRALLKNGGERFLTNYLLRGFLARCIREIRRAALSLTTGNTSRIAYAIATMPAGMTTRPFSNNSGSIGTSTVRAVDHRPTHGRQYVRPRFRFPGSLTRREPRLIRKTPENAGTKKPA